MWSEQSHDHSNSYFDHTNKHLKGTQGIKEHHINAEAAYIQGMPTISCRHVPRYQAGLTINQHYYMLLYMLISIKYYHRLHRLAGESDQKGLSDRRMQ